MQHTRIQTEQLRECLAADVECTADLQEGMEATADLPNATVAFRTSRAPIPKQPAFGFLVFAGCALVAMLILIQEPSGSSPAAAKVTRAGASLANAAKPAWPQPVNNSTGSDKVEKLASAPPMQSAGSNSKSSGTGAALGLITFESRSFSTSERAVAAVFIVRRANDVRGRAVVHWAARSGSADAGIDFSDASGTVRFADGQRQRAIYVPLRNDLLIEADETFKVCLRSSRQARIRGTACAEAIIRDDDSTSQI